MVTLISKRRLDSTSWAKPYNRSLLLVFFLMSTVSTGCSSMGSSDFEVFDPNEGINRSIYSISDRLDKRVVVPVARSYKSLTPGWLRAGISNISGNILELDSALNAVLQGKSKAGFSDFSRVLLNSTIGIGGVFDAASDLGIDFSNEDLGQTFGMAGWSRSRYLYVPIAGPTTMRDAPGMAYRSFLPRLIFGGAYTWWLGGISMLNTRAEALTLTDTRDSTALDPYAFTREAYYQRRKYLIFDGDPPADNFFEDFDEDY